MDPDTDTEKTLCKNEVEIGLIEQKPGNAKIESKPPEAGREAYNFKEKIIISDLKNFKFCCIIGAQ